MFGAGLLPDALPEMVAPLLGFCDDYPPPYILGLQNPAQYDEGFGSDKKSSKADE